jgi:putative transposase
MPWYRRRFTPGGTYFFTVVTQGRRPLFGDEHNRRFLRAAIDAQLVRRPVETVGMVLLDDHLHALWTLPPGDAAYSTRWRRIKEEFTDAFLAAGGTEAVVSRARRARGERGVWQRRFWEHECRDEDDVKRCLDYIHWNPVKHGYVTRPVDYPWSSFHRWVKLGEYDSRWGDGEVIADIDGAEWE